MAVKPIQPPFINGPIVNGQSPSLSSPSYHPWLTVDRILISGILSPSILASMEDFPTSSSLWQYLVNRFSSLCHAYLHELKAKMHNLTITSTISEYLK